MSGGAIKKLRKQKIKEGLKNNKATKVLSEALVDMKNMTDEEWEEFAKKLAEELGVEDADKEGMIKRFEEKVGNNDWFMYVLFG